MKQSTFEMLINRIVESEKKNEVLRYKNTELNGAVQSMKSQLTMLKAELIAVKNGAVIK